MSNKTATFKAAMIQMRSGLTPAANVDAAAALIAEAKAAGADYVQTPEMTNLLAANREQLLKTIVEEKADPSLAAFRDMARKHSLHVHVGSLAVKHSDDRASNRAFLLDPQGEIVARYDKIHMFDVELPSGETYRESNTVAGGSRAVIADLPWGRIGLTICYDLRFPTLYRRLAQKGAFMLTVPSAFTETTGKAHWHVLLCARAIENGAFVIAPAQGGAHANGRQTYGHSLIVAPWGEVLAEAGTEPDVIVADIDPALVDAARNRVPNLRHDRAFEGL